jgi:hypothetical protein
MAGSHAAAEHVPMKVKVMVLDRALQGVSGAGEGHGGQQVAGVAGGGGGQVLNARLAAITGREASTVLVDPPQL